MRKKILVTLLCLGIFSVQSVHGTGQSAGLRAEVAQEYETLLIKALNEIRQRRLDVAFQDIETLVRRNPKFKLAQLIYGDLLLARSRSIDGFGNHPSIPPQQIAALRHEAQARWQHHLLRPLADTMPQYLVQLQPTQRYAIVVDLTTSRLYLFANRQGTPYLLRDYYISSGKNGAQKFREGDQKTPVGVYFVTGRLPGRILPDLYGVGAFPINYPNEWDRRLGKTGYGIWLHGVPSNTFSRPPRASNGCVALSNTDLMALTPLIDVGHTPVIIAERAAWIDKQQWRRQRAQLTELLDHWRRDWESLDTAQYLRHYSKTFFGQGRNYATWAGHKRRVNARKTFLRVALSDVGLFTYPGEQAMVVATFQQDYQSNNLRSRMKKRQYWRREADGVWRIVYEGPA